MAIDLSAARRVSLAVQESLIPLFFQLLGQGVFLEVQAGCSLKDLLCTQLGIPPDYLKRRIQTMFLNASPVDAPENATVAPGAIIALSAAMPGLVGAVMRKGGHYAGLRQAISYGPSAECPTAGRAIVRLKFFNLVAAELGPGFLGRGVGLRGEDWQDFLRRYAEELDQRCAASFIDGKAVALMESVEMDWSGTAVLLTVVAAGD